MNTNKKEKALTQKKGIEQKKRPVKKIKSPLQKKSIRISFHIHYATIYGESLEFILQKETGNGKNLVEEIHPMHYIANAIWQAEIELPVTEACTYFYGYRFRGIDQSLKYEAGAWRSLDFTNQQKNKIMMYDSWNPAGEVLNVLNSTAFDSGMASRKTNKNNTTRAQNITHRFEVYIPLVQSQQEVYLLGNADVTGNWMKSKKSILKKDTGNVFYIDLALAPENFPFAYKYALYDTAEKALIFENGPNRILNEMDTSAQTICRDGFGRFEYKAKKAFGISIPVFSLRSEKSGGVGEFNDLKLFGDWATTLGCSLVQILPVNDTTTTGEWADSYPYSAISAFALHPIYLHLPAMAGKKYLKIYEKYHTELMTLNALPAIDYVEVSRLKWTFFKEIYPIQKKQVFASKGFQDFYEQNYFWLEPYAAFCYLRDKNKTADFTQWRAYTKFNAVSIKKLLKEGTASAEEINLHIYLQYMAHLQLRDAVEYLQQKGICLKGDIAIGMKQGSADHWQFPELFHDDLQAGAPPDAFSKKGQNWGFPIYHWEKIKEKNFQWWQQKLRHHSRYNGAIRLDHVLGFFRIWSIPLENMFGTLGYFHPATPLQENDFWESHIYFDEERFCRPYISSNILWKLFGEQCAHVKQVFFTEKKPHRFQFKEPFDTQKKLHQNFKEVATDLNDDTFLEKLLSLHAEKILLKEEGNGYHFRINMEQTNSFQTLDGNTRAKLLHLYHVYFYEMQEALWKTHGESILPILQKASNMMICAEDLGWSPGFVQPVLQKNNILGLEVQRMPKFGTLPFTNISEVPYLSVVTSGTHDMEVIRGWWQKGGDEIQYFYNQVLKMQGEAPKQATDEILLEIYNQFIFSPAMWCILPWQDILGCDKTLANPDPALERINHPDNAHNNWNYRMHLSIETLITEEKLNATWKQLINESGRS